MSLARIYARALSGIEAPEVVVEVHLSAGLPALNSWLVCLKRRSKKKIAYAARF